MASAFLAAALAWAGTVRAAGDGDEPARRVIVVANSADPESLPVALHYARARGVPEANVIALPMPVQEEIRWGQFVAAVWQPLQDTLVARGWIRAVPARGPDGREAPPDALGRRRYLVSGHRIRALVTCRGVPLKIADEESLRSVAAPRGHAELRTNGGAVDSELSLLANDGAYPIDGYVPNPLFGREDPGPLERSRVVVVSRLDGPTAADAAALVDRAMLAERQGLIGRACVVLMGGDLAGERWLRATAGQLGALGFETSVSVAGRGLPADARCDAPVLYFGWHQPNMDGPFALPGFRFPPGAIAFHIHSYSAWTLHSTRAGWCGPLVADGAAATLGNVDEPYLEFTHRPDLLLRALARGKTLGEAAYYALPVLSWQSIVIGDPLYRPFSVALREQLRDLDRLPARLAGYPVLRLMHLLDSEGRHAESLETARSALAFRPGMLPLALELARRLDAQGRRVEALRTLGTFAGRGAFAPDEWAMAREAADLLLSWGNPVAAGEVYGALLGSGGPVGLRRGWLEAAARAADAAGRAERAAALRRELESLEPGQSPVTIRSASP